MPFYDRIIYMKDACGATSNGTEIEDLQQENDRLQHEIQMLKQSQAELEAKLKFFEDQLRLSRQRQFGTSSEQMPEQIDLFNEAESETKAGAAEPTFEEIVVRKRKKPEVARESLREDLPVEIIEHRLPEDQMECPCCEGHLHEMAKNVRKELIIIPAQVKVLEHWDFVYNCPKCALEGDASTIVKAPTSKSLLPKAMASASVVAHVITQKFMMGVPLYRQELHWEQMGVNLSRQTLSNWLLAVSAAYLQPMCGRMRETLLQKDIIFADETTLQVLKEPGRSAQSTSYMWMYRSGRDAPAVILYEYQTTRASKHPKAFLAGFKGYLHADGYAGYHDLPGVTVVGCWSHSRRKYTDALKAVPEKQRSKDLASWTGLDFCNKLFKIEKELHDVNPEERYAGRLEQSLPVLNEYHVWLKKMKPQASPKSLIGQAITYSLNQWEYLTNFLKDGRLELDNNRSERSIKPFVISRKNFLFSDTPRGATGSAAIFSIVESAKQNGLKVLQYLVWLLERVPNIDIHDGNALDELMPWSPQVPDDCKTK